MNEEPANDNEKTILDIFDFIGAGLVAIVIIWFKDTEYYQAIVDWL